MIDKRKEHLERLESINESVAASLGDLDKFIFEMSRYRESIEGRLTEAMKEANVPDYDVGEISAFLKQPYAILPRGRSHPNEWWVVTPAFSGFRVGYHERRANGWDYYIVNKYMTWIGRVPEELVSRFKFKRELPLKIINGFLWTGTDSQEEAYYRYREFLTHRKGPDRIFIKKGCEFDLIASIIEDGMLPFVDKPVDDKDLKPPLINFELREYQKEWWDSFIRWGAIGVFAPMGSGKTYAGLYAIAALKGKKLVVVPTRSLIVQWRKRIDELVLSPEDVDVYTYMSYKKLKKEKYVIIIFDECHRLPANTFSRMATLKTKYRIGLSGTPYREDGRTNYIFALTGVPKALSWRHFFELDIVSRPTVSLYLFSHFRKKEQKVIELVDQPRKTIIFVWKIQVGKRLEKILGLPFVYGRTPAEDRIETIQQSEQVIVSSVGSEGISIPTLERVIEYDWLGKSRREEVQRMGRLFHSQMKEPEHIILMTEAEFRKDESRLMGIYEKGFRINIIR